MSLTSSVINVATILTALDMHLTMAVDLDKHLGTGKKVKYKLH